MAASPARTAAFEILSRVEDKGSYASELLHSTRFDKLSTADHGLTTELVMGVLRWRSSLDEEIAGASSQKLIRLDKEVLNALRLGVYQLRFLSRVPARAAIFESVELVKASRKTSAATFVNAVLRKVAGKRGSGSSGASTRADVFAAIADSSDAIALARISAHPEWLVERWIECFGLERTRQICAYDQQAPPTSIRIYDHECLEDLARQGIQLEASRLVCAARTVSSGDISRTLASRQGRIAIQDEGSQLVGLLVGHGDMILDSCAAPGGKALLIAKRNPDALVVASDVHVHRASLLQERVGLPNVRILAADARQLPFTRTFDRILADVPCSGTGTLARNPEIKWRLKPEHLRDLQSRQLAILKSGLAQLARRGRLVYATCSLEREENEAVVHAALDESPGFSIVDCKSELQELQHAGELCVGSVETLLDGPFLRTIPGLHTCDGFFAAIIEKA